MFSVKQFAKRGFSFKISNTQLLINGKFVNSTSGKTFDTINPATGKVLAQV